MPGKKTVGYNSARTATQTQNKMTRSPLLLTALSNPGLIDYALLAQAESLKDIPDLLDSLLKEAHASFDSLLAPAEKEAGFSELMEPFLTQDQTLNTLFKAVESLNSTDTSEATRKIVMDFQPKLVDYGNKVSLSRPFYDRLKALEAQELTPAERRSLELVLRDMEMAGVHASQEKRERLQEINAELSELAERFSLNVTDSRADFCKEIDDEAILAEMPESDLQAAQEEAKRRDLKSKYAFTLSPPSATAILRYCSSRELREEFHKANSTLATRDPWDNRPVALRILRLRQEKAQLLGFPSYAHHILQERMAPSPQKVEALLEEIGERAKPAAQANVAELQAYSGLSELKEWDLSYYAEKLKKERFSIEDKQLRPYFPLEETLGGLFALAKTLFGVEMRLLEAKAHHPEAKAYEVLRNGERIAYYLLDPFARPEKRGGAWANDLRPGYALSDGTRVLPIVINVCNFSKGSASQPPLLTHRDVETIFHEFGHALHVMLSSAQLPNLNGFRTEWDFVELPSQILENWCWEKESLDLFAKHFETGEGLPTEWIEKLRQSKTFLSGLFLARQNEFGCLDWMLHSQPLPQSEEELDQICLEIANRFGALPKFPDYRMYASFSHIFAGGYAAGYYSYAWAELLEADVFNALKSMGAMSPQAGHRYAEGILCPGASKPASLLFRDFMSREPDPKAFFRKHGLE